MATKTEYIKTSVSLPEDLWDYARNQKTNAGIPVPASRVIAFAIERLMKVEKKSKK